MAAGLADSCEMQVSCAIGVSENSSVSISTFDIGKIFEERIIQLVRDSFDMRLYAIPACWTFYRQTSEYGHFGRYPFEMSVDNDTLFALPLEMTRRPNMWI